MNDPKRLVAELHSPLMNELLSAAQREQLPDELRQRMSQGLALALGGASLGAGIAASSQIPGAIAGAQQTGVLAASSSVASGTAGIALNGAPTVAGASGSLGGAWANTAVWIKAAVAASTLIGAAGVGTWLGAWPVAEAPSDVGAASVSNRVEPLAGTAFISDVVPATPLVAAEQESPVSQARPIKTPSKAKTARSAAPQQTVSESQGDLGREVRLLDAARRAIISGDLDSARAKLAHYSRAFPNGALRAEAASLAKAAGGAR